MIKSTSKAGIRKKLVYNESIILAEKNDTIEFPIMNGTQELFVVIFRFDDEGTEFTSTMNPTFDPNHYDVTLHRWYSSSFVETTSPWDILVNNVPYWILWRTSSTDKTNQRTFHLSVWTILT